MSLLSRIGAAIRAALSSVRTIVRRCSETGRLIFETVRDAAASIGVTPAVDHSEVAERAVPSAPEPTAENRWDAVRALAAAMAGDRETPDDYLGVSERDASWLSAVSRTGLVRVAFATDAQLEDHVRGKRAIAGVCAADPASVFEKLAAISRQELAEAEVMGQRTEELLQAANAPRMAYA